MKSYLCNQNYMELYYLGIWNQCVHNANMDFILELPKLILFTDWVREARMISQMEHDWLLRQLGRYRSLWIAETADPQGRHKMDYPIP